LTVKPFGILLRAMKRLIAILLLCSLLLLSCGENADNDKIQLSFWQFWTSPDVKPTIEGFVTEYEELHPDTEIELIDLTWSDGHEKIVVAFSTDAAPDIVELGSDWIVEFADKGVLMDVSEFHAAHVDELMMWEPAQLDGAVYAIPWLLGTRVMYCNLDLMHRADIDSDRPPGTWKELLSWSGRISELGAPYYGFGSNSAERHRLYKKFLPFLWSNGGRIVSEDGTTCRLDQVEAIDALRYYVELSDVGLMETQRTLDDKFLAGEIGFILSGDWLLRRIATTPPDFDLKTALIPVPNDGDTSVSFFGGEYLAISNNSPNRDAALQFAEYLVSRKPNYSFCTAAGSPTPANVEAARMMAEKTDSNALTFLNQIRTARTSPAHPKWVHIEEALERAVEQAIYHQVSPVEALLEATNSINEILAE